jgi:hypothetical protein
MLEILDSSNGSRRVQIEFLRNGETERPFVKLRAVRIEPGAIPPWETHETEPELYDPEDRTEPVIVLPVQYFGRPAALHQPERRLMLAARLPQRDAPRVVTAFTSISSALIRDPASGEKPTVFTCADDKAARSTVIALAKEIGFEGVDAGHLDASRNIENLGLLVGQLAYGSGFGNRVTLRAYVAP